MDPNTGEEGTGFNALHYVCRFGRVHEAETLIHYGADVNLQVHSV